MRQVSFTLPLFNFFVITSSASPVTFYLPYLSVPDCHRTPSVSLFVVPCFCLFFFLFFSFLQPIYIIWFLNLGHLWIFCWFGLISWFLIPAFSKHVNFAFQMELSKWSLSAVWSAEPVPVPTHFYSLDWYYTMQLFSSHLFSFLIAWHIGFTYGLMRFFWGTIFNMAHHCVKRGFECNNFYFACVEWKGRPEENEVILCFAGTDECWNPVV